MRIVYLNGAYVPENEANITIFDRGFLFADGVYEVTAVVSGKLLGFTEHMERLQRSLDELLFGHKICRNQLLTIHRELIRRNKLDQGIIYSQITRGSTNDRDFLFPPADTPVTMVMFSQEKKIVNTASETKGWKVVTVDDLRWGRRDIKTTQLLYPSLAKMQARARGADDAWLVQNGFVTEGASSNAYIVKDGKIITRNLSRDILHGITRKSVLACGKVLKMNIEERPFTIEEAWQADEAFSTSASSFITPVVEIDGKVIGSGKPGPVGDKLRAIYLEESLKAAV